MSVLEQSIMALRETGCHIDSQMGYYMVNFPKWERLPEGIRFRPWMVSNYEEGSRSYSRPDFQLRVMKAWLEVEG